MSVFHAQPCGLVTEPGVLLRVRLPQVLHELVVERLSLFQELPDELVAFFT